MNKNNLILSIIETAILGRIILSYPQTRNVQLRVENLENQGQTRETLPSDFERA